VLRNIHQRTNCVRSIVYYLFIYLTAGVEPSPQLLWPLIGLLYQPWKVYGNDCEAIGGINNCQGKLKYWEKSFPGAVFSTTDRSWLDTGSVH
jgi:hypothetical protein